ncbi:pyridoxamine 5'-phosphate oxidase family protein, partial [Candidatus Saccharibacteria bacterium]|nr:pyridoxamine 5'-phosphate oxidase family protein [Candidatus Saccharibacteria bacterium]
MTSDTKVRLILDTIRYITLATVTPDGKPWSTPVAAYHFAGETTLYWASWQNNQHSQNIRNNGKAFVTVYDSTPDNGVPSAGVYMQANAFEITDEAETMRAALVFGDDPYNPSDGKEYLGDKPRRIYKVVPRSVWINDDSEING